MFLSWPSGPHSIVMTWPWRAAICLGLASLLSSQQRPPATPFQTVHLLVVRQGEEKKLVAAMADYNVAIAKVCSPCVYRLWKVEGAQSGPFNYLWISSWPGPEVYEKVHESTEYAAASNRHPELEEVLKGQVYNRYVEVKPDN